MAISVAQVTHVEIMHAIRQLLSFNICGLVDPVAFVVAVWARAVHADPLPIAHVYQHLPQWVRAICNARQGKPNQFQPMPCRKHSINFAQF